MPKADLVKESTTRTRFVSPEEQEAETEKLDPWEYMESLSPEEWDKHIVYLYRIEPRPVALGGPSFLQKFTEPVTIEQIRDRFGGRVFRIFIKKGSERVVDRTFQIEAAPKFPSDTPAAGAPPPGAVAADGSTTVGLRALDLLSNQPGATAMFDLWTTATKAIIEMVKNNQPAPQQPPSLLDQIHLAKELGLLAAPAAAATSPMDKISEKIMDAMVQRMLSPSDHIKQFSEMATAMKELNLLGGRGERPDTIGQIVGALPTVMGKGAEIIREWRLGTEAQERAVAIQRGVVKPAPVAITAPASPAATAANPQPSAEDVVRETQTQIIEQMIVNMVLDGESTGEDCGAALDAINPAIVNQLQALGKAGILALFSTRSVLKAAEGNPRLDKFIDEFLAYARTETPATEKPN